MTREFVLTYLNARFHWHDLTTHIIYPRYLFCFFYTLDSNPLCVTRVIHFTRYAFSKMRLLRSKRLSQKPSSEERSATSASSETCSENIIKTLRREIHELNQRLTNEQNVTQAKNERMQMQSGVQCDCKREDGRHAENNTNAAEVNPQEYERVTRELNIYKDELAKTRNDLIQARQDQDALRLAVSKTQRCVKQSTERTELSPDTSDMRIEWVGKYYLAVTLPEDYMFRPGEFVTPSRVLHKLFEVRVGVKIATGFTVLLENTHIFLASLGSEWYQRYFLHSCNGSLRIHGHRIDSDEFAWLLFEYGAHSPMIEVMATHQSLLMSTGKGGITTLALNTNKAMYSAYVSLFRETVANAHPQFLKVKDRAYKVYRAEIGCYVPVDIGLTQHVRPEPDRNVSAIRSKALRSVLENIQMPAHIKASASSTTDVYDTDPFRLGTSLEDFIKTREKASVLATKMPYAKRDDPQPYKRQTQSDRLHKRIMFQEP